MKKDHYIENNNLYNHKYLFMQADSIKHETCLDTRDQHFARSLYFSVDKTDQNFCQEDVVLSAWDFNVSTAHSSHAIGTLVHSLELLDNKLYRKSLCHGRKTSEFSPSRMVTFKSMLNYCASLGKRPKQIQPKILNSSLNLTLLLLKRVYNHLFSWFSLCSEVSNLSHAHL